MPSSLFPVAKTAERARQRNEFPAPEPKRGAGLDSRLRLRTAARLLAPVVVLLFAFLALNLPLAAQQEPSPDLSADAVPQSLTSNSLTEPCVEPPPIIRLRDYNGPLDKVVGFFAEKSERKAVHQPDYKPGVRLCSLGVKDKFVLFLRDSYDPVTFVDSGFNAGISQGFNWDPTFGQGARGYAKRYGAAYADQVSVLFFKDFAYPLIFSEDPRYYRQIHGTAKRRLLHAVGHAVVAHRDNGERMFNFSEWLGTTSAVVLSNTYHPGNKRGVGPAAELVSIDISEDIGFDILREFWPEIARKLKLPFHIEPVLENSPEISKPTGQ